MKNPTIPNSLGYTAEAIASNKEVAALIRSHSQPSTLKSDCQERQRKLLRTCHTLNSFSDLTITIASNAIQLHSSLLPSHILESLKNANFLNVKNVTSQTLTLFCEYLYADLLPDECTDVTINFDLIIQLLSIANSAKISDLTKWCIQYLSRNTNVENIWDLTLFACETEIDELKKGINQNQTCQNNQFTWSKFF